ncbi:hypothetical protein ACQKO5_10660 [Novosphingobium subterraneum]|uniref:hypothetical protein n=1 Tax=Novosphingobium subterraneum TaxID=48936 RepID=UPI003D05CC41
MSDPAAVHLIVEALRAITALSGEWRSTTLESTKNGMALMGEFGGDESGFSARDCEAIPQIFLHSTCTGQNSLFFSLFFRCFDKS